MTLSVLSSVVFYGSTVTDKAKTLADLMTSDGNAVTIDKGFEVQNGTEVYAYTKDASFTARPFVEGGTYGMGEVVVKDGILQKITSSSGEPEETRKRPKEPEEYAAHDTDVDFNTWTHRYFKMQNTTHINGRTPWANYNWTFGARWYYMFWENRGYGGCGTGAWRFSAKDQNRKDHQNRNANWYKRSCLKDNYSESYNAAKDVPADIDKFSAPGMPKLPTLNFHSVINRNGYFYFRTHVPESEAPLEYVDLVIAGTLTYTLTAVTTPMDIPGFEYKRKTAAMTVFDGKNYTGVDVYPEEEKISFIFGNTEDIDTIALGRVLADTVDIIVRDYDGNSVEEIKNYPVDNVVLEGYFDEAVTAILYTKDIVKGEHVIEVVLHGNHIQIGDIVVGLSMDAGFTNLTFSNNFKDYSPQEEDQWGNYTYIDGVKVLKHSGSVDVRITSYDHMVRMRRKISGNEIIINGSDSKSNTPTNSKSIFQSTMMIGRFKDWKISSKSKGNKIGDVSTYTFSVMERV
jgi:hypothetical protein